MKNLLKKWNELSIVKRILIGLVIGIILSWVIVLGIALKMLQPSIKKIHNIQIIY
ncbi:MULTISPECIES: hypothetical protein [unclassified Clostridium]|uniref:hypothetical protein n=1 Tax=unclassified Clostridium TaxID=2614128 RepID=UPI00280B9DFA|nr:hypothetical protein [Clostridium sp.]MDY4253032.1 hypothetical protein [Clostridium sp.]MDY6228892.1 hypothetical protein [Clostridium sp.]